MPEPHLALAVSRLHLDPRRVALPELLECLVAVAQRKMKLAAREMRNAAGEGILARPRRKLRGVFESGITLAGVGVYAGEPHLHLRRVARGENVNVGEVLRHRLAVTEYGVRERHQRSG